MKQIELISVIVPIYNVEKYLKRCIESILKQSYQYLEIILVNDGSQDKSIDIIENFKEIDGRVYCINKANGGLSDARNAGIVSSTGKYLVFVDGDDYLEPDYIKQLYDAIIDTDADVSACSFNIVNESGRIIKTELLCQKKSVITGKELLSKVMTATGYKYVVVWNKMYKKAIFDEIKFRQGMNYEDEFINFRIFYDIKKVTLVEAALYDYVQRVGSITQTDITYSKIIMKQAMHNERMDFYMKRNETELYSRARQMYCNWIVSIWMNFYDVLDGELVRKLRTDAKAFCLKAAFSESGNPGERIQDIIAFFSLETAAHLRHFIANIGNKGK